MSIRRLTLFTTALLLTGAVRVRAQNESEDKELRQMESRLQEQRAGAVCSRLILYSDELRRLQAKFTTAGDVASAAVVQTELDAVALAVTRLTNITRGQVEPPETGELKPDEKLSGVALTARRVDAIIAKFSQAQENVSPERTALTGQARLRALRIEKAAKNPSYPAREGGNYWGYGAAYAVWTLNDLAPGEYEIQLRYSSTADSGGKAVVKAAGKNFEVTVPRGEKDSRQEQMLTAGVIKVKEPGVDVRVENGGLADKAQYLFNLHGVSLVPVGRQP